MHSSAKDLNQYQITVQDKSRKIIPSSVKALGVSGELSLTISEPYCAAGRMYFISAVGRQEVFREKLVVGMK